MTISKLDLKNGCKIPVLGLGTYTLTGDDCQRAVRTALELGYNHIDTAEMYGNEAEIGKAIQEFDRSELFLTSKVWPTNLQYNDVLDACSSSLEKLRTSYLDLYLIHWPNDSVPLEETFGAMRELYEEGKICSMGVSNFNVPQLKEAMEISEIPITVNQVEFHPWFYQEELLDFCESNDIVLTAYLPLARTKVLEEETVQDISNKYEKTPAQVVLRWEVQKGTVTIPRSSSRKHLEENMGLFDWELKTEDMEKIDNLDKDKKLVDPLINTSRLPPRIASFLDKLPF